MLPNFNLNAFGCEIFENKSMPLQAFLVLINLLSEAENLKTVILENKNVTQNGGSGAQWLFLL